MKDARRRSQNPLQPLETGQIWKMADSQVIIGTVGKRLVHYKYFKGDTKRPPSSLANLAVLEKFLKENNARLQRPQA